MLTPADIIDLRRLAAKARATNEPAAVVLADRVEMFCGVATVGWARLTRLESQVMVYVVACVRRRKFTPSIPEIARQMGMSRSCAHQYVVRLREKGMLRYGGRSDKRIALT